MQGMLFLYVVSIYRRSIYIQKKRDAGRDERSSKVNAFSQKEKKSISSSK
jgi:hypothetical protein